ncbi:hypothetical protein Back11_12140 [Paenibacillus baekrokdamisoli]|uniref:Uncharacterized protein n=1 Tax=Paenibacillus baekrokdamisoli TaxID=1712516 RepID=A0A3G9JA52_9BACL|nr:hypothetical protein [Paenibacillus baekrokdamisoli]MBB3070520.1 hypothetical protein [Paenibacillus baekrokdamisoli]BBH19869.1 hypothetical protein Back11_12140 [Paenibacillus baekrokdamisoli]
MADMVSLALMDDILRQTTVVEKSYPLWGGMPLTKGNVSRVLSDGKAADLPVGVFGSRKVSAPSGLTLASQSSFVLMSSLPVNSTQAIVVYYDGTSVYACVVTEINYVVSYGTAVVIATTASGQNPLNGFIDGNIVSLGGGKFLTWYTSSGNTMGVVLTVSGSAVSVGSVYSLATGVTTMFFSIGVLTVGSKYVAMYSDGSTVKAVVLTITGTTIALGSVATLVTAAVYGSYMSGCGLSATLGVVTYSTASATFIIAFSVSGTTITAGTALNATSSANNNSLRIFPLSATTCVVFYGGSSNYAGGFTCSISGTVVTKLAGLTLMSPGSQVNYLWVMPIDGIGAFAVFTNSSSSSYL